MLRLGLNAPSITTTIFKSLKAANENFSINRSIFTCFNLSKINFEQKKYIKVINSKLNFVLF